jgi:23S rRNA (cytosine1962-C5)-methyltransferase
MLDNRLRKRHRHLTRWARREGIEAYRVYDRDIPELPLAIDLYGPLAHVQIYQRGRWTDEEARAVRDEAVDACKSVLGVDEGDVFVKVRERRTGLWQYEKLGAERREHVVSERGHRFLVNLSDYLDTGLFLDHRDTRRLVGAMAQGTRFLNLFAYTGSFSIYAAAGGARQTTTVDLSNTYIEWAGRNFALNGHTAVTGEGQNRLVREDTFRFLEDEARRGAAYDLVVLDPPTVSTSKKMAFKFDVQTNHPELLALTLRVLAPGGTLVFSNNFKDFQLDTARLPPCTVEEITARTIPPDFRDDRVHRCWLVRHLADPGRPD